MTELPGSFVSEQLIRPDLLEMTYRLTSLGKYLLEGSQICCFQKRLRGKRKQNCLVTLL